MLSQHLSYDGLVKSELYPFDRLRSLRLAAEVNGLTYGYPVLAEP